MDAALRIPSIMTFREYSTAIRADLLRRDAAGNWPEQAIMIEDGTLDLRSIDFNVDLPAIYRGTRLAQG